jgi:hypothetical protein
MRALCFALISLLLASTDALAEPLAREDVPEPLAPWVDWVLRDHEQDRCPALIGDQAVRVCAWPSELELDLGKRKGRFAQRWFLNEDSSVALPGDKRRWPQDVRVDGEPVPVVAIEGRPHLTLPAGSHLISGLFLWDALPELLQVPATTALIDLRLHGETVPFPNRDGQGRLWLQKREVSAGDTELRLDVQVHRRVLDDIPLRLETRIELNVAGRSREVLLGRALPEGFVPVGLTSPLPTRLDADGRLRVQVRPGRWQLSVDARDTAQSNSITLPEPGGDWDASEEWVFEAQRQLRLVTIENGISVDPNQTTLPSEWRHLPAYQVKPGQALSLVEERRGDSDPAPDQLTLARELWLDFDGGAYTASDTISGTIRRSMRLEMAGEIELGRAAINGRDQVITRLGDDALTGVEVTRGPIALTADSRIPRETRLPAVGWNHDFQALGTRLNLPPGWTLFHARGVDSAATTWLERWTLLDLFAVLVLAAAFQRLWGTLWGVVALATLALTWTELGAPHWAWAATLGGIAVVPLLPAGRIAQAAKIYRAATLVALVLLTIPFAVTQVRAGLFPTLAAPQNDSSHSSPALLQVKTTAFDESSSDSIAAEALYELRGRGFSADGEGVARSAPLSRKTSRSYEPDPNARITTGPGLPAWNWTSVDLLWSGPVASDQHLQLVLIPPFVNRLLAFARVGALAALILCLLGALTGGPGALLRRLGQGGGSAVMIAAAVFCATAGPRTAAADIPSDELLTELRQRLLEAPQCSPRCASSPRLALEVTPRSLRARIEIDAAYPTAVPMPGGARSWSPTTVTVDGKPASAMLRQPDGTLWLLVEPGRHQVVIEGALPERDSVELPLPLLPHHVTVQAEGWTVAGVHEDGIAEANLQLARIRAASETVSEALEPGVMPPFVRVTRSIELGLEWRVQTRVMRVSPADTSIVIEIPLLDGESLNTEGIRSESGHALVSMGPGQTQVQWQSLLDQSEQLHLLAPADPGIAESWQLDTSPIWHVSSDGIPPVHDGSPRGTRTREWRPWPGETLTLQIERPSGVAGATTTIDLSDLELSPGLRATDANLSITLRSSRGGPHSITLPEGAELEQVTIDGSVQPIRQEGREVRIPLRPGKQQLGLHWREPHGGSELFYRAPEVDLGSVSVNSNVSIAPLLGRWTLFAGGPRLGPAVLFWPLLAVFAAISLALSRFSAQNNWTPLRFAHWFLLSIGLSQVPVPLAAFVIAWLLVLGWRGRQGSELNGQWFNVMQILLVGASVVALLILFYAIQQGLLGQPEMQVAGNGSYRGLLRWYQDRAGSLLPQPWVLSVPLLIYRLTMLAWALWLALMMMRWLRWGWECFSDGELWRTRGSAVHPRENPPS